VSYEYPQWFRWWLFPGTYLVHFIDELVSAGGLPAWMARLGLAPMSTKQFVGASLLAIVAMTVTAWGVRKGKPDWLVFALTAIVVVNALFHLTLSFATRSYSPGTASGVLLWLPLGAAILWRGSIHPSRRSLTIGLIIGIGVNVMIGVITVRLGLGRLS
jgi:hypothetical protein